MVAAGIIFFVITAGLVLLGITQLLQKGKLLNNAWLYANEEERRTMNKKPYYIQSGIVFVMIGIQFLMLGFFTLTKMKLFLIAEFVILSLVVIYAVVSSIMIDREKKKEQRGKEA
ncbi:MAG: DUF3784 domain-containing protein [Eubacterium sp.]|nr:DUF3784 domain-containing protein [Eubacterium sp.]